MKSIFKKNLPIKKDTIILVNRVYKVNRENMPDDLYGDKEYSPLSSNGKMWM